MKAGELMIGDLLYYKANDCYGEVTGVIDNGEIYIDGVIAYIADCAPIPLTPEILEKNGFVKSVSPPGIHARCYELDNPEERHVLTIADYNKYKRLLLNIDSEDSECFNIKCAYIHQLQHALKLCGIEKNIII